MTSLCHADYRSCRRCGNSLSLHRHDPRLPPAARPPNRGSSGPAGHDEGRRLPKKVCLFAENIKSCTGGRDQALSLLAGPANSELAYESGLSEAGLLAGRLSPRPRRPLTVAEVLGDPEPKAPILGVS